MSRPFSYLWNQISVRGQHGQPVLGCLLTWHQNVSVVGHEVLNDLLRTVHNVDVTPVYPRMLGLERCV